MALSTCLYNCHMTLPLQWTVYYTEWGVIVHGAVEYSVAVRRRCQIAVSSCFHFLLEYNIILNRWCSETLSNKCSIHVCISSLLWIFSSSTLRQNDSDLTGEYKYYAWIADATPVQWAHGSVCHRCCTIGGVSLSWDCDVISSPACICLPGADLSANSSSEYCYPYYYFVYN